MQPGRVLLGAPGYAKQPPGDLLLHGCYDRTALAFAPTRALLLQEVSQEVRRIRDVETREVGGPARQGHAEQPTHRPRPVTHLTQAAITANVQLHTHQLARRCAGRCGGRAASCGCVGLAEGPQAPPAALQDAQCVCGRGVRSSGGRGSGGGGSGGRRLRRSSTGAEGCGDEAAAEPQAAQAAGGEGRQRPAGTGRAAAPCGAWQSAIKLHWYA